MDFRFRTVSVADKTVKLQIWDTAGQERFRTITSAYYRGADGIIMVYDVTHRESFEHVREWLKEVRRARRCGSARARVGWGARARVRRRAPPLPTASPPRMPPLARARVARLAFSPRRAPLAQVEKYAAPETCKLLIGNKSDRTDRAITEAEGAALAKELGMPLLETSARTSDNVEAAFNKMAENLIKMRCVRAQTAVESARRRGSLPAAA